MGPMPGFGAVSRRRDYLRTHVWDVRRTGVSSARPGFHKIKPPHGVDWWRKGPVSPGTIIIQIRYTRRFRAYCARRKVPETETTGGGPQSGGYSPDRAGEPVMAPR